MNRPQDLNATALRLRQRRTELNLSLQQVAERTGMSRSTLQRYETGGIRNLPVDRLKVLADALQTTPEWIMGLPQPLGQDPELMDYLEELKNRSEMRMLFKLAKDATKEDVERAVKIIEALKK
ncbi:helix-turn-helix domain-containing protein [Acidaminobacterium chupaoyuni]